MLHVTPIISFANLKHVKVFNLKFSPANEPPWQNYSTLNKTHLCSTTNSSWNFKQKRVALNSIHNRYIINKINLEKSLNKTRKKWKKLTINNLLKKQSCVSFINTFHAHKNYVYFTFFSYNQQKQQQQQQESIKKQPFESNTFLPFFT